MTNSHERKSRAMDRSTHYRKIYQDTITRAGIVEGRPLTDYEKDVFAGIIATRERVARLIEEGYGILDNTRKRNQRTRKSNRLRVMKSAFWKGLNIL